MHAVACRGVHAAPCCGHAAGPWAWRWSSPPSPSPTTGSGVTAGRRGSPCWLAVYALGRYADPRAAAVGAAAVAAGVLSVDVPRLQEGSPIDEVLPGWLVLAVGGRSRTVDQLVARGGRTKPPLGTKDRDRDFPHALPWPTSARGSPGELHDLVAHSMAVTVLHAQAAQRVLETDPAPGGFLAGSDRQVSPGRDSRSYAASSRSSTTVPEASPLDPPPTLARVPTKLVAQVRAAGLPVTLTVEGSCEEPARRPRPVGVPHRPGEPDQRAQARGAGSHRRTST